MIEISWVTIFILYNLKIIIDASHAHGAEFEGLKVGNIPCEDVTCFSLGKRKLMTAGELGVAVTNDYEIYQKLLFFGLIHNSHYFLNLTLNTFHHLHLLGLFHNFDLQDM